jgi:glyoxylase-like metal-dependent hydrolase (beta-lactamase superfamily II)
VLSKASLNSKPLCFKTSDIKVITTTHGHFDHVGDLASFQKDAPGAKTYVNERDAPALEPGGNVDYRRAEGRGIIYCPVTHGPLRLPTRTRPGERARTTPPRPG